MPIIQNALPDRGIHVHMIRDEDPNSIPVYLIQSKYEMESVTLKTSYGRFSFNESKELLN